MVRVYDFPITLKIVKLDQAVPLVRKRSRVQISSLALQKFIKIKFFKQTAYNSSFS